MIYRSSVLAAFALATLFAGSLSAGIVITCPDTLYPPEPIPGLGAAQSCGQTVTPGPNSVDINVDPFGIFADSFQLEAWLGLSPGALNQTVAPATDILAFGGSAMLFPSFSANPGDTLQFAWSGSFEPDVTAYLFYLLDGALSVLDYQVGLPIAALVMAQPISLPLAPGTHSLAFGAIIGAPGPGANAVLLDPTLNVTNLAVVPAAVPEPGSVALFGIGLAALAALRRKRS